MKNELDELLTRVLTPREEPGDILNRKILNQVKEGEPIMKSKKYKRASAAVIAAAVVAASSITAVAAWQYRSASQVAEKMGEEALAAHFAEQASEPDAVMDPPAAGQTGTEIVGESQSYGGYTVTVLGLLSGEDLSPYQRKVNGEVHSDRTYCVTAIEKEDGTAVDAEQENFFVSPLIGGLEPWKYNAASFGGSYSEFVEEGVLYRLSECDNIECFADRELYLCVSDTSFYDTRLYAYDEATGSVSRNEDYEGLNALFTLKLDASLADPAKAQALIDRVNAPDEDDGTGVEIPPEAEAAMEWARNLTSENLEQYCVRMENTVQTVFPNEDGVYVIEHWLVNEAVSDTAGGSATFPTRWYNSENYALGTLYTSGWGCSEDGMKDLVIDTFILNEDGSMTFAAWVPKDVSIYLQ